MKPCISTTICLLDAPNTDCQYVETVVGFAQKHDLMWEPISILNLWDNLFKSLVKNQWCRALYLINGSIFSSQCLIKK